VLLSLSVPVLYDKFQDQIDAKLRCSRLEHGVYNISRMRESAANRYKVFRIPVHWMLDSGFVTQSSCPGMIPSAVNDIVAGLKGFRDDDVKPF
ncbi:hypothetical protein S83_051019, partial [Arachis hypogaea]